MSSDKPKPTETDDAALNDPAFRQLPPSGKGYVIGMPAQPSSEPDMTAEQITQAELEGEAESRAWQRHREKQRRTSGV
jgi:hypothetical protein